MTNTDDKKYEPDTSDSSYNRNSKSKLEQVAKTPQGRVMQQYAEEVRDEIQETTGLGQFLGEKKGASPGDVIAYYTNLEYNKKGEPILKIKDGLTVEELDEFKSMLEDVKLPPTKEKGKRQTQLEIINRLTKEVEMRIDEEDMKLEEGKEKTEVIKAKDNILNTLSPLGNLYEGIKKAIGEGKWNEVRKYNIEAVKTAEKLHEYMAALSEKAPDEMVKITGDIARSGLPVNIYKTILINFAQTHKLPRLGENVLMELKNQQKYGKSKFAEVFLNAYLNKPKNEDPVGFIRAISKVPVKHFNEIHQEALKEMAKAA